MGMYTELYLTVELKKDLPQDIVDTLTVICAERRTEEHEYGVEKEVVVNRLQLPDEGRNIFSSDRVWWLGRSSSYYFAGDPFSRLRLDNISQTYHMSIFGNIKNYGNEIQEFLNWLQPHVDPRGYAGHIRYEEDYVPTLIFFRKEGMKLIRPMILLDWDYEEVEDEEGE